jgi:hypothetical protein
MSNTVQWLVLTVRKVSNVGDPAARQSNVANVSDAPIFSPHFRRSHLFLMKERLYPCLLHLIAYLLLSLDWHKQSYFFMLPYYVKQGD